LFASEFTNIKPDIICISKGITGGYLPLGLTLATECIYQTFVKEDNINTLWHGHSYTGNALACAAASATLTLLQNTRWLMRIEKIEEEHQFFIDNQLKTIPNVLNARCLGVILAFELAVNENSSYFNNITHQLRADFIKEGLILRPLGNTIYFLPPYCITKNELKEVYNIIIKVISKY
jgi:adenosylmethionine-8-amino-7-oxononanoate aminotransferase